MFGFRDIYVYGNNVRDRVQTPWHRPEDEVVTSIVNRFEGHYEFRYYPRTQQREALFHHYHDGAFDPPIQMIELEPSGDSNDAARWLGMPDYLIGQFDAYGRYYPAFLERNNLMPRDHNGDRAVVRMRKGKAYKVYFRHHQGICEACPFPHFHGAELWIEQRTGGRVAYHKFGCADYPRAVEAYHDCLKNIDPYIMESML